MSSCPVLDSVLCHCFRARLVLLLLYCTPSPHDLAEWGHLCEVCDQADDGRALKGSGQVNHQGVWEKAAGAMLFPPWDRNRKIHEKSPSGSCISTPAAPLPTREKLQKKLTVKDRIEASLYSEWQVKPLQVSASPPQAPVHNRCEALDVAGLSADNVDDGPSTPEMLPTSERPPSCHDPSPGRKYGLHLFPSLSKCYCLKGIPYARQYFMYVLQICKF